MHQSNIGDPFQAVLDLVEREPNILQPENELFLHGHRGELRFGVRKDEADLGRQGLSRHLASVPSKDLDLSPPDTVKAVGNEALDTGYQGGLAVLVSTYNAGKSVLFYLQIHMLDREIIASGIFPAKILRRNSDHQA